MRKRSAPVGIVVIGMALTSAACDLRLDSREKPQSDADRLKHDQELVKNLPEARIEFERRLTNSIAVRDSLLLVRDPSMKDLDLAVMPANAFWVLHCGIGFTIDFGGGGEVSDGAEMEALDENGANDVTSALSRGTSSGAEINLSFATIDAKTCDALAPDISANIQRILRGD